jgi:hypothetical protein
MIELDAESTARNQLREICYLRPQLLSFLLSIAARCAIGGRKRCLQNRLGFCRALAKQ